MTTSIIPHPPDQKLVILKEDFLKICDGNIPSAIILGILEYWTNIKLKHQNQTKVENKARAKNNMELIDENVWIYKSNKHFAYDSLSWLKKHEINHGLKLLLNKKFIEKRRNPKYHWDRTLQYKINIKSLTLALSAYEQSISHPRTINSADADNQSSAHSQSNIHTQPNEDTPIDNRSSTGRQAIPEITVKIKKEETNKTESIPSAMPHRLSENNLLINWILTR